MSTSRIPLVAANGFAALIARAPSLRPGGASRDVFHWRTLRDLDPASLKLFIAVIEEGTIAGAAAREHVTAAAVSKRITRLEASLRTELVNRTNRGLEPTAAGIALSNLGRRVLLDLEEVHAQLHDYATGLRGHVRMCANITAITQFLPGEIASFLADHPQVQIRLEEKTSAAIVKSVAESAAHIGIFTTGSALVRGVQTFPYRSDRLIVVTPNRHPLADRQAVSFGETLGFDYVGLQNGSAITQQLLKSASELDLSMRQRIAVTTYDALCLMVEAGLGIGILSKAAAQPYIATGRIHPVALDEPWANRELRICVRTFDALPAAAVLLVDHLRQARSADDAITNRHEGLTIG